MNDIHNKVYAMMGKPGFSLGFKYHDHFYGIAIVKYAVKFYKIKE